MSYLIWVMGILTAVAWLCIALPTPQEHENMLDKLGQTTGRNWR